MKAFNSQFWKRERGELFQSPAPAPPSFCVIRFPMSLCCIYSNPGVPPQRAHAVLKKEELLWDRVSANILMNTCPPIVQFQIGFYSPQDIIPCISLLCFKGNVVYTTLTAAAFLFSNHSCCYWETQNCFTDINILPFCAKQALSLAIRSQES